MVDFCLGFADDMPATAPSVDNALTGQANPQSTQALLEKLKQRMPWNQGPSTPTSLPSATAPIGKNNVSSLFSVCFVYGSSNFGLHILKLSLLTTNMAHHRQRIYQILDIYLNVIKLNSENLTVGNLCQVSGNFDGLSACLVFRRTFGKSSHWVYILHESTYRIRICIK